MTNDLRVGVSFLVIDNSRGERAESIDFLATQVQIFGGRGYELMTSDVVEKDTFFDFWSSTKNKRYSVTRWQKCSPDGSSPGHTTVQTYGPLLFEVLNNDPDFVFIENLKIALSPRFRKGCREMCDKVLELRKAQGQGNPPVCQEP